MQNWNRGEEKPAECEDWKPKGEVVRVARATKKNNSSKRRSCVPLPFFFFLPPPATRKTSTVAASRPLFSQTEPLFRAPDVYLRAAIKQWLFAGLARAGSRTASSLWENTLPHRLSPPPPRSPPEHFISLPMAEGKAPPPLLPIPDPPFPTPPFPTRLSSARERRAIHHPLSALPSRSGGSFPHCNPPTPPTPHPIPLGLNPPSGRRFRAKAGR